MCILYFSSLSTFSGKISFGKFNRVGISGVRGRGRGGGGSKVKIPFPVLSKGNGKKNINEKREVNILTKSQTIENYFTAKC